jgi:hypothetical protein
MAAGVEQAMEAVSAQLASDESARAVMDWIARLSYLGVVGSRDYPDLERVDNLIKLLNPDTCVVSGGARGVDVRAEKVAYERNLMVAEVRARMPDNPSRGEAARRLFARNTVVVRGSELVIAFWDGSSHGTADTIRKALDYHGLCVVVLPGEFPAVWITRQDVRPDGERGDRSESHQVDP